MVGPVLSMQRVGVVRGGRPVLTELSWEVNPADRWVVLGANGAGKTTVLQLAATALAATTGTIRLLGEDLATADLDDLAPSVGVASAAIAELIDPSSRVLDVVTTGAMAVLRRHEGDYDAVDDERATRLLRQFGCRELIHRAFGELSEGERKRVQIARALMPDPELLLLDEPAAGLDLGAREALLFRLRRLAADPLAPALVLVTHHVEEIPAGFTHALLLRQGRTVAAGPLDRALTGASLSQTFGFPVQLRVDEGRFTARAG